MTTKKTANPDSIQITLGKPLTIDGAKVSYLTMREPTVNDQLVMDNTPGSPIVKELAIFANLCLVTPADLGGMNLRDYKKLQATFETFTD